MSSDPFFASIPKEHSLIKTELVVKYFIAWSGVMLKKSRSGSIGFADLFAGSGRFIAEGNEVDSTPLEIVREVVGSDRLKNNVRLFFNDKNPHHVESLKGRLGKIERVGELRYPPVFTNEEVGKNLYGPLLRFFSIPTLYFIDPYGYKGMSTDLVQKLISGWGSDCVFFFNYDAVNRALNNDVVSPLMQDVFGTRRVEKLKRDIQGLNSTVRERQVLQAFRDTLGEHGGNFTIAFRFLRPGMERTSHYIVFASKVFLGYDIMRDIMARVSHYQDDMPKFEWAPGARQVEMNLNQPYQRAVTAMEELLLKEAAGTAAKVSSVYEQFSVDTPFIRKRFKEILVGMEAKNMIRIMPDVKSRRKGTLGDDCMVAFPSIGET